VDQDTHSIEIDHSLYNELREYCDRNGLRFLEFIEETLEAATYRDELENLLRDEAELKLRIEHERSRAIGEGFTKGVLAILLALQGNIESSKTHTPPEAKDPVVYRPVTGPQLPLFK